LDLARKFGHASPLHGGPYKFTGLNHLVGHGLGRAGCYFLHSCLAERAVMKDNIG
jgi:hypothetical protein